MALVKNSGLFRYGAVLTYDLSAITLTVACLFLGRTTWALDLQKGALQNIALGGVSLVTAKNDLSLHQSTCGASNVDCLKVPMDAAQIAKSGASILANLKSAAALTGKQDVTTDELKDFLKPAELGVLLKNCGEASLSGCMKKIQDQARKDLAAFKEKSTAIGDSGNPGISVGTEAKMAIDQALFNLDLPYSSGDGEVDFEKKEEPQLDSKKTAELTEKKDTKETNYVKYSGSQDDTSGGLASGLVMAPADFNPHQRLIIRNSLEVEDAQTGRPLSLWQRATRRYQARWNKNSTQSRARFLAHIESYRKSLKPKINKVLLPLARVEE